MMVPLFISTSFLGGHKVCHLLQILKIKYAFIELTKFIQKVKERLPPPKILKVVKEPSKLSPPSNFPKWAVELRFIKI